MPTGDLPALASMTRRVASGKAEFGSGRSIVAKLKLKEIDGKSPPGVEPSA